MGSQVLCCAGAQIPCKKHAYLGTNKSPSPWIFPNPEGLHHKRDHEERHWLSDLVQLLVPPCSSRVLRARRLSRCDRAVGGGGGRVRTWSLRPTSKPLALQEIKDSRKYCEPSLAVLHFPVASGWCFCTPLLF